MKLLRRLLPFLAWFDNYDKKDLRADAISGLTVALVLVPQSMAYAQLAGLPPYYGLYAAFLPPMIASLFGSSRQLATGPVAIVSLMTAATLEPLATAGSEQYVAYALLLALVVGLFQFALGLLRLGVIVNFLSHPVVSGFSSAAAIIIATSQLSKVFGVYVDKAPHHYETVYRVIVAAIEDTHWPTFGMAALAITTMVVLKKVNRKIPNVLVAVAITTLLSWAAGFQQDETVALDRIDSPELTEAIGAFNAAVEEKKRIEEFNRSGNKKREELTGLVSSACARCHQSSDVKQLWEKPEALASRKSTSEELFLVHHMAGLIGDRLKELKKEIAGHRAKIREVTLAKQQPEGSPARFVPLERLGGEFDGDEWRVKVGNKVLPPDALILQGGGAVVAEIPAGLPGLSLPVLDWNVLPKLLIAAMIISLLGFMEAISIAKAMAARTRQTLDSNQELIGQGLANIVGCMSMSYAVSGSFSRSAVNLQAGAKSGLSNVFSSAVVMLVLLFFSGALYHLPQAVLASVIIMAVVGLLDVSGFMHTWRTSYFDGAVLLITFVATLVFAPHLENGIVIGVVLSLGGYLFRTMRPQVKKLAPHPDGSMRDCVRHNLPSCDYIATLSFEGPLNFASANYLQSGILERVSSAPDLRHVVISGNGISEIDASGEETIRHLVDDLRDTNVTVAFTGLSDSVLDVLKRSRLYDHIGEAHFYGSRSQAISAVYADAHRGVTEPECPYQSVIPPVIELSLHTDGSLRNAERHQLEKCRHIAIFRFDGPLNFANTSFLEKSILESISDRPTLRHVVLACHSIPNIDEQGAAKLVELTERLRDDGLAVTFTGLKEEVRDVLTRTQALAALGKENVYPTQLTAIASLFPRAHTGSSEQDCPLESVAPRLTELSLHDSGQLREARSYHLKRCARIGVLRLDGPMALFDRRAIQSEFIRWAKERPGVRSIILKANKFDGLNLDEASNLAALVAEVREAGYLVAVAGLTDRAFEVLARNGIADELGMESFFPNGAAAVAGMYTRSHAGEPKEQDCPLAGLLPRLVELSLHPDGSLRDASRHGLSLCRKIVAIRFDGRLNFATGEIFRELLEGCLARRPEAKHILFATHTLTTIDPIGMEEMTTYLTELENRGYRVVLSGLKDDHLEMLQRVMPDEEEERIEIFPTQVVAIEALYDEAHEGSGEDVCPLRAAVHADGESAS